MKFVKRKFEDYQKYVEKKWLFWFQYILIICFMFTMFLAIRSISTSWNPVVETMPFTSVFFSAAFFYGLLTEHIVKGKVKKYVNNKETYFETEFLNNEAACQLYNESSNHDKREIVRIAYDNYLRKKLK